MKTIVHHQAAPGGASPYIHLWQLAWDGNLAWDFPGIPSGNTVDFSLPEFPDLRLLQFKYREPSSSGDDWEPEALVRQSIFGAPAEIWTFEQSPRIITQNPFPAGVSYKPGGILIFKAITQSRFRGGRIYAWNPYDPGSQAKYFSESARDDAAGVSTFAVTLEDWMVKGFHLKLTGQDGQGHQIWEPDTSNRVWRPCDGSFPWIKSGQCDVRSQPLALASLPLEVLIPASLATAPVLSLRDTAEDVIIGVAAAGIRDYPGSALLKIASYSPAIYPQASYTLATQSGESPALVRPFPANPADLTVVSRFAMGASAWLHDFHPLVPGAKLQIQPRPNSSLGKGVTVEISVGNASAYAAIPAFRQADGALVAALPVLQDTTTSLRLRPDNGQEVVPYAWIDTGRYFTATAGTTTLYTTEGVYGVTARGKTLFAEPPSRVDLMRAAFGPAAVPGLFGSQEMPLGAIQSGTDVCFAVHAPHAVWAALILVDEQGAGGPVRQEIPMALTPDARYWWCSVPVVRAVPGTRYRFVFNDSVEVIDPAAREVTDAGSFETKLGEDPRDPATSWARVADVAQIKSKARAHPWNTMGWQKLMIYEIHARRFTDEAPGGLPPLSLLADELRAPSRTGQPGYLNKLPITALGLMPVQEFNFAMSWGYDPSFYFAIDSHYGGPMALAEFVDAAHQNGRAVTLDVVYNHSMGSSLVKIAPEVYRNGDYDGDQMNCGHPMMGEFFRQATVYLWQTFGLDGFRFDDTKHIINYCQGGWEFLGMIRSAVRAAAAAEGQPWPYCLAENHATQPWDISDPGFGVMDGEWGIDEVYRLLDASYDTSRGSDTAPRLKAEMDSPAYFGRPFFQATRFGESHDMVSAQDSQNQRIAARPPFGQGLRTAKALGALTLLSNGVPMLFMGQEVGEAQFFSFDNQSLVLNPQKYTSPPNSTVLGWFRQLMGLRNDPAKGLQGGSNYQVVQTGHRTVAFTCGTGQSLFAVATFGTANQQQNSAWLGLPGGSAYKEIFNSSWPDFQVESESEMSNGGYNARIGRGDILNLPWIGMVVLERA